MSVCLSVCLLPENSPRLRSATSHDTKYCESASASFISINCMCTSSPLTPVTKQNIPSTLEVNSVHVKPCYKSRQKRKHTLRFNGHFPGEPGLAGCPLNSHHHHHHLEEHSRFHDASPGRTIRCSPQCRVKSKVEQFEIALDCLKPGLTGSASWAAPINREAIGGCS